MGTTFAAVLYRHQDVSERALSHAFGVALSGFDLERPSVLLTELESLPAWSAAFYQSGTARGMDEHEHAADLFEQELPPGLALLSAAERQDTVVYALVYSDDLVHDDGSRFSPEATARCFVVDGEEGIVAGRQVGSDEQQEQILASDADDATLRPHRGSTFLSQELGTPVLPILVRALFEAERRLPVRMVDLTPEAVSAETKGLNRVLRRQDGRGAFACASAPLVYQAFVATYDWADPTDAADLFRELAIGHIQGTLHFYRPGKAPPAGDGFFPIAALRSSALGGGPKPDRMIALGPDQERLFIIHGSKRQVAGPTFGELLAYLRLGWSTRDAIEEDFIGALMLRAKIQSER